MSKALDYLIKTRPEAMGSYFTFLKQAGTHLDKKTAALISVITKVHSKTANGLRQYLPRALKEGASADEIIDALLFAMPALGFSKIVWAMEVILEMDLPEFEKLKGEAPAEWREIAAEASLTPNAPRLVKSGRDAYYVIASKSPVVYSAECPHNRNIIPESGVDGATLTCPFHDWKFDFADGRCTHGGTKPLKKFEAKSENGKIWIR